MSTKIMTHVQEVYVGSKKMWAARLALISFVMLGCFFVHPYLPLLLIGFLLGGVLFWGVIAIFLYIWETAKL